MNLKIVQQYDSNFTLEVAAKELLFSLLKDEAFLQQIAHQAACTTVEFTELLFQPVPYAPNATKGMPIEYEPYHDSEDYVIINVPPNFMFQAKVFQPSRLCAIYRKTQ
ncbi:MAG: hypothetical protein HC781_19845 [Leptolyngbyaceae cyanobacterium CSU_1_4]|nr:hypothetical protein [Leptolyngbyaceae cyanobacterium CSU_1_4]